MASDLLNWWEVTHDPRCNIVTIGAEPLIPGGDCTCEAVNPRRWWCGHLHREMPAWARNRGYCLQGHLIPTTCGWVDEIGSDDE